MKKKLLVLGAVTCVAGIVTAAAAGCSSTEIISSAPDATDARSERVPVEAAPEDAATCLVDPQVTAQKYEADPGYKPGKASNGACSTAELTQFETNLDDASIKTWKEIGTDIGTTCAECLITSKDAATWGPIVYTDDVGNLGFYNFGACFGVVEKKESCGKAIQFTEWCIDDACNACTTQAERDTCVESALDVGGVCEAFVESARAECKNLAVSEKKCNNIVDAATFLCGPAIGDGGTDGGDAGDAGDAADQ